MSKTFLPMLLAVILAVSITRGQPATAPSKADQQQAIIEIENLGGHVDTDDSAPDRPVVTVDFTNTRVTDAGLACLKALGQLQTLELGQTGVTDAAMENIKGLSKLKWLNLSGTKITDAALENIKDLSQLQWLVLTSTKVTDAGLERLAVLSKLKTLNLRHTNVTEQGVNKLQEALPQCKILYP